MVLWVRVWGRGLRMEQTLRAALHCTNKGADFVFALLDNLCIFDDGDRSHPSTATEGPSLEARLRELDDQVAQQFAAVPPNTLVMVVSGQPNTRRVSEYGRSLRIACCWVTLGAVAWGCAAVWTPFRVTDASARARLAAQNSGASQVFGGPLGGRHGCSSPSGERRPGHAGLCDHQAINGTHSRQPLLCVGTRGVGRVDERSSECKGL